MAAAMEPIKSGVKKGERVWQGRSGRRIFSRLLRFTCLQVGEETGRLDTMLLQIAETYDSELRTAVKRLIAFFEPAIILVMGLDYRNDGRFDALLDLQH